MQGSSFLRLTARLLVFGGCLTVGGCRQGASPLETASSRGPRTAEQLYEQGRLAWERGDGIRAEQYLTLALDQGMPEEQVLPLLVHIGLRSARLRGVLDYAEPYLLKHPEDDGLRCLVATVHWSLGQGSAARDQLDRLLRRNASYPDAHYLKGVLETDADAYEARAHFQRYLELAPAGAYAAEVRGRLEGLDARRARIEEDER